MSNLAGGGVNNGRTPNGGSRAAAVAAGAVPVPRYASNESPSRVRTPRMIMQERMDREARKKEDDRRRQAQVEEARKLRDEQENIQPEIMADAVGGELTERDRPRDRKSREPWPTLISNTVNAERRRTTGDRGAEGGPKSNVLMAPQSTIYSSAADRAEKPSNVLRESDPADINLQPPKTRSRRAQSYGEPRPVEARVPQAPRATSGTAVPPASTEVNVSQPRRPSRSTGLAQSQTANAGVVPQDQPSRVEEYTPNSQQRSTKSSFPHAFERWENLSAHWEGLTSFWIRRLETNKDEINRDNLNKQLARQVTDLSAAGANLFHAVVELQRLRASSERKFQRWFIETRAEQERAREIQAKLEEQLQLEKQAQLQATTSSAKSDKEIKTAYAAKNTADVQLREMRRELAISRDEARRAWEELGRMVQDERDRTTSLRNGEPTLVGGVQVVPMMQGVSRQGSTNRPPTRDVPPTSQRSQGGDPTFASYDPARSENDTDPFTESGRSPQVREDPIVPSPSHGPQQSSGSSSAAFPAFRGGGQDSPQQPGISGIRTTTTTTTTSTSRDSSSYTRSGGERSTQITSQPGSTSFYQHEGSSLNPDDRGQIWSAQGDERSFVPSVEDTFSDEDAWSHDSEGQVRLDANGDPVMSDRTRQTIGSEDSDEFNVQEQLEREQMYGQRYGSGIPGVEYGSGPTGNGRAPEFSGAGYGPGWEAVPRHHHPTRLSDVLEEDERSRTSPSRASQTSRGIR